MIIEEIATSQEEERIRHAYGITHRLWVNPHSAVNVYGDGTMRSDRRLEQGYYDESLYDETMRMEDAFAQRAYYYAVKQGRPVRHRRRDEE